MTAPRTSPRHFRELFGDFVPEIGLRADGQDRAADRVGVMRAVLFGVGLAGAVHPQDGPGAARLFGRVHHVASPRPPVGWRSRSLSCGPWRRARSHSGPTARSCGDRPGGSLGAGSLAPSFGLRPRLFRRQ